MRSRRPNRLRNDAKASADKVLSAMLAQAEEQFGDAVKSFWFYEDDLCPGGMARPIGVIKMKGENAVAINAFIYRPRGVLIEYFLCQTCATYIFDEAQKNRKNRLHCTPTSNKF